MQKYPNRNGYDGDLELFDECDCCGTVIRYGNAVLEVCRLVERRGMDMDTSREIITVIDQAQLAILCAGCANRVADRRLVMERLVDLLDLPAPASKLGSAINDQTGSQPEICNLCHADISGAKELITVGRRIAQVDYGEVWENAIITTMDAEDMLYFCVVCGNDMIAPRLSKAVLTVVAEIAEKEDNCPLAAKKLEMVEDAVSTVRKMLE